MKTVQLFLIIPFLFAGCTNKKNELVWSKDFYQIGSTSSFRATDLNSDGILDLVIGAGKNEFQFAEQGILALNGKNGELLWQEETDNQIFGSATFLDVTGDGIEDVFIGGRSNNLKALDGKTGELLWKYMYKYETHPVLKYARFDFYNCQILPDQNGDGINELLAVCGGNVLAPANSENDRYPGVLMVLDPKSGEILAADTMPDRKESYMSPIVFQQPGSPDLNIVFGSGGEKFSGHLYLIPLTALMQNNIAGAHILAEEVGHGFISPPSAADINEDGYYDIIAISHGSTAYAIDGRNFSTIWKQKIADSESSNSFGVGQFTDDNVPDFFTFVSKGEWPDNKGSIQVMFNGKNGNIEFMDSIGCTGFSSPVVYDLNHDGYDEVIMSINEFDCSIGLNSQDKNQISNRLLALDFKRKEYKPIDQADQFKNIFTTPWIGDLDGDGFLDIVYAQYYSASTNIMGFLGMRTRRISTNVKAKKPVFWGEYMGLDGKGIYPVTIKNP
ncbi:MAG: PQQ-binding-like beta-propeller repeat protein [Cyclobacteriaceae bacterium]|nr:PQQ-binding-like beta-propeller repeat protein [Cyclobacteriaceae bacterium]